MSTTAAPAPSDLCPYKGLQPYTENDRAFFFGRERDQEIVVSNLYAAPLTVFFGASGAGKTSVLLAGVVPQLRQEPHVAAIVYRDWQHARFDATLKDEVLRVTAESIGTPIAVDPTLPLDELLLRCVRALHGPIFLILDQFEEYFLYHPPVFADGFDGELARVVNRKDIHTNVLVSLREDGLSELDRFRGRIPNLLGNMLRLEHLDREAATRAIRGPLDVYNSRLKAGQTPMRIEDNLVVEVLAQVGTGQVTLAEGGQGRAYGDEVAGHDAPRIETPFLQLVLTRLWDTERAEGSFTLRMETFARLGGARHIVRTHLDTVMSQLDDSQRDIAARIFHYLVTPSGTKVAYSVHDLTEYLGLEEADVTAVLSRLSDRDMRILRRVEPPGELDQPRYEIFHDVLAPAVLDWRTRYGLAQQERELAAAQRRAARERQRARRAVIVAGTCALLCLVTIVAVVIAYTQEQRAKTEQAIAFSRALAANAITQIGADPELGVLLAAQAVQASHPPTQEAITALREALVQSHVRAVLSVHGDISPLFSAMFSPDGRLVVTASDDGTARLWQAATGHLLHILGRHRMPVRQAVFSPDGALTATASDDGTAALWRTRTGTMLYPLNRQGSAVTDVAFSPDGRLVATTSQAGPTQIWSARTGRRVVALADRSIGASDVVFSPNSQLVVTVNGDNTVRVWSARTGAAGPHQRYTYPVNNVGFSPDGHFVMTASGGDAAGADNTAFIWDVHSGRGKARLVGHMNQVKSAAFSPDGKCIVTASKDETARIWTGLTQAKGCDMRLIDPHAGGVNSAAFSPDSQFVALADADGTAKIFSAYTGVPIAMMHGHHGPVYHATFSSDGRFIVTASADGTARVWQARTEQPLDSGLGQPVTSAAYSRDGRLLVTTSSDVAQVWDAHAATRIATLRKPGYAIVTAAFSPNGKLIVTASDFGPAIVWQASSGRSIASLNGTTLGTNSAAFSADGKFIVITSMNKPAQVWQAQSPSSWRMVQALGAQTSGAFDAVFSPDGKSILTVSSRGPVQLWQGSAWTTVRTLGGPALVAHSAAFSPNGQRILTVLQDGTARLWNVHGKASAITLPAPGVTSAAFSPDGTLVVTKSTDGTVRIWNAGTDALIAAIAGQATIGRQLEPAMFSPDGQLVALVSQDDIARVYSAITGALIATLAEQRHRVTSVAFNPAGHGQLVVTAPPDNVAHLYSCDGCGSIRDLEGLIHTHVTRGLTPQERQQYHLGGT